ncbi:MAG: hypothetical protein GEU73_05750 [Chloroflexi bacterium]|nr:hypothetical protein [Chloroflexota bacterium]
MDFDDDENESAARERKARAHEPNQPRNRLLPSSYLKRNFWFTIETELTELAESMNFLGAGV